MNPDIKARWVADLRSGQFKQGQGQLRDRSTNTYCCLGVLCHQAVLEGAGVTIDDDTVDSGPSVVTYADLSGNSSTEQLPIGIAAWAGLNPDPEVTVIEDDDEYTSNETLAVLNDNGHTFEQIADWIEDQL